ncbi:DUF2012 domain-containing protein, partial [Haematococcus lacustris]
EPALELSQVSQSWRGSKQAAVAGQRITNIGWSHHLHTLEAAELKLAEGKDQGVDGVAVLAREHEMNQALSQRGLVFRLLRSEYRHSWEHAMPVVGRAGAAGAHATSKLRRELSGQAVRGRASTCVVWQAPAATLVKLFTADGQELQSFVQSDGSFEFKQVPPGSHLLQPFHISYFYPEVKVDVSPKAGLVRATQLGQPKPMQPHALGWSGNSSSSSPRKQLGEEGPQQWEVTLCLKCIRMNTGSSHEFRPRKRKPVDVWSIVKSPYGLMIVFSLFFIFVMPMLKVDPEEMKEAQAAMRGVLGGSSSATEQPAQQRITGASR